MDLLLIAYANTVNVDCSGCHCCVAIDVLLIRREKYDEIKMNMNMPYIYILKKHFYLFRSLSAPNLDSTGRFCSTL